jgi:hypothetical protein
MSVVKRRGRTFGGFPRYSAGTGDRSGAERAGASAPALSPFPGRFPDRTTAVPVTALLAAGPAAADGYPGTGPAVWADLSPRCSRRGTSVQSATRWTTTLVGTLTLLPMINATEADAG